jgi:hypothetical protein
MNNYYCFLRMAEARYEWIIAFTKIVAMETADRRSKIINYINNYKNEIIFISKGSK